MVAHRPRAGIVPVLQSAGADVLRPMQLYDFRSGDNYEELEQLNPVIGMRGQDSLSYAPQALQEVWSDPNNGLQWSNKFDEAGSWGLSPSTATQINATDWAITHAAGGDLLQAHQDIGVISHSFEPLAGGSAQWLYFSMRNPGGTVAVDGWINGQTLELGSTGTSGAGVLTSFTKTDGRVRLCGELPGVTGPEFLIRAVTSDGGQAADIGAEYMLRNTQAHPGDIDRAYVETQSVAALDNWTKTGDAAATFSLAIVSSRSVYRLDNSAGVAQAALEADGAAGTAVPHTQSVMVSIDGAAFSLDVQTVTASVGKGFTITAEAGEVVDFYEPQWCEGPQVFDLKTQGFDRYLIRSLAGVGRISEPDVENKCQNYSVSPTDTTGITDGAGVTTTVVDRASLPSALQTALDLADPDGTIAAMYRSQGSGTVYATGPTGNQNEHFVRGLIWGETGTAAAVVGLEDNAIAPLSTVENLEWVGGKGTPLANSDRWSLAVVAGDVYWIANMMHEGNRERSHIPVAGSNRTRNADKPIAATDEVGIDRRRNSVPNSDTSSAVLGEIGGAGAMPTGWSALEQNGWQFEVVEKGETSQGSYLDLLCTGTITGSTSVFLSSTTTIEVAAGDTFQGPVSLSLIGGDLTNVTTLNVRLSERDDLGAFIGASSLPVLDLISATLRRYNVQRVMVGNVPPGFVAPEILVNGSGAVSFTFRIQEWAAQHSTELLPHIETTGTAIEYQQWDDGLTVVDEWDIASIAGAFLRTLSLYGNDQAQDAVRTLNSTGVNQDDGYLFIRNNGVDTNTIPATSIVGLHTQQSAMIEGDQEFWVDGASQGTLTSGMPNDIDTVMLGDDPVSALNRDGIQKSIAFYDGRAAAAI